MKFLFLFIIIHIITRLFFHFVIILVKNYIGIKGAKALAETLKHNNKNITDLNLGKSLQLFA